jgi:hypothetical protein
MKNYNNSRLSGSGLAIKGMKTASVDEILALPPRRYAISSRITQVLADIFREWDDKNKRKARARRYEAAYTALADGLETALRTAWSVMRDIEAIGEIEATGEIGEIETLEHSGRLPDGRDRDFLVKKITSTNDTLRQSETWAAASFLLQSDEPPATDGNMKDFLHLSTRYYKDLAASAGFTLSSLDRRRTANRPNLLS